MTDAVHAVPSDAAFLLNAVAGRQLRALQSAIAPHVLRHPDAAAPASIVADAHAILGAVSRLIGREAGWRGRLLLGDTPSWSEIGAKLALAAAALARYADLTALGDEDDEDEADDGAEVTNFRAEF